MNEFKMPKMDHLSEEARIVEWFKSEGQSVAKGEIIMSIETGKCVLDVESPFTGVLKTILEPQDADVPVGAVIAYYE